MGKFWCFRIWTKNPEKCAISTKGFLGTFQEFSHRTKTKSGEKTVPGNSAIVTTMGWSFSIKGWKGDFQPFGNKKKSWLESPGFHSQTWLLRAFFWGDLNDRRPPCKEWPREAGLTPLKKTHLLGIRTSILFPAPLSPKTLCAIWGEVLGDASGIQVGGSNLMQIYGNFWGFFLVKVQDVFLVVSYNDPCQIRVLWPSTLAKRTSCAKRIPFFHIAFEKNIYLYVYPRSPKTKLCP